MGEIGIKRPSIGWPVEVTFAVAFHASNQASATLYFSRFSCQASYVDMFGIVASVIMLGWVGWKSVSKVLEQDKEGNYLSGLGERSSQILTTI